MFLKQKLILLAISIMAGSAVAEKPSEAAPGSDTRSLYPAPELYTGIRMQYRHYSFFVKGDAFAVDVRVQNFYNGRRVTPSYFNLGGYIEHSRDHDLLGTPVPIGVVIGMDKNFQAYIQAEPNFDLNDDKDIKAGGAVGIRFQF